MFYFHRNRYTKPSVNFVNEDPKSLANKIAERKQLNKPAKIKCKKCCTTSTPEWCSGPNNKKSLCNVCGLKWSKSQKKESIDENSSLNRGVKRRAHSFDIITPTVEIPFLENPSKQKTKDNDKKNQKESSSVELQKIDDKKDSEKKSASINKFSLPFILS